MVANKKTNGFIWNSIGSGLVACQTAIVVFLCARLYTHEISGIVSFSYAAAILVYTISRYGIRNYQITDINEKYHFNDYLLARIITILFTLCIIIAYILVMISKSFYSVEKGFLIIELVFLRIISAVEDVFFGRFQQLDHFEIGAKIMAIREFATLFTICILMLIRMKIYYVFLPALLVSLLMEFILLYKKKEYLVLDDFHLSQKNNYKVFELLKECFPLCIGSSLAIYASNIPKYVTDWYLDDFQQAVIGYLLLPVFTISLLNQFIYTPFIKELGDVWNAGEISKFLKKVFRQLFTISISCLVIIALCLWIGIPLLSELFAIDLSKYRVQFILLLIGGGLYTMEYYLIIPVTVIRKQKHVAFSYMTAILFSSLIQKRIVLRYHLNGVALLYCVVNFLILVYLFIVLFREIVLQKQTELEKKINGAL